MKTILAFLLVPIFTIAAQAGDYLSFDEIREACLNPEKFQNQVAPKNLQISCEDRSTKWVPTKSEKVELVRSRQVISSLSSDKYEVMPNVADLPLESQYGSCPRFKEMLELVSFTKATSCEEILEFKGSETEFCAEILDNLKQTNPKMIRMEETGNSVDLCSKDQDYKDPCDRSQRGQGRCRR